MKLFVFALLCLAVNAERVRIPHHEQPPWNLTGEQPKDQSYEVRVYNSSKWVSTNVSEFTELEAQESGFEILLDYITGTNDQGIQLDLTGPITVQTLPSTCVMCKRNYTISLYIPSEHQTNPPEPLDSRVYIDERNDTVVYARKFIGSVSTRILQVEAYTLMLDLERNNVTGINESTFILAQYATARQGGEEISEIWSLRNATVVAINAEMIRLQKYEQPPYNLTETQPEDKSYEVRLYNQTKWVSTRVSELSVMEAEETGVKILLEYTSGLNDQGIQVARTVPVNVQSLPIKCAFCKRDFIVSLYLPSAQQANPPTPLDNATFIDERSDTIIYTRKFFGNVDNRRLQVEAFKLMQDLERNNVTGVSQDTITFARYSNITAHVGRLNEVMFFGKAPGFSQSYGICDGCCTCAVC